MQLIWSQVIFTGASAVSLPLYLIIMTVCVIEWKHNHLQRTFYLLIISQGVVDIIVMVNYFIFGTIRTSRLVNDLFWEYQHHYVATWCFIQIYISMIIRCFGILLISLQRYLSLCKNGTQIEQFVNTSHRWTLPILHWAVPAIYSIPLLNVTEVTFLSREKLEMVVDRSEIKLATSMTLAFISISFLLCSFCYAAVLRFLVINRYSNSVSLRRERRLYVQMLGLFFAFGLLVIYNSMQFTFSLRSNDGPIYTMRTIYPIISCFLSYINAWTMFALNVDIRAKIFRLLGCKKSVLPQPITTMSLMKKQSTTSDMLRSTTFAHFKNMVK